MLWISDVKKKRHAAHTPLRRAFTFPARGIYNVGMAWTIYFKDSATFEVRDGGLDFDYTTGEILAQRPLVFRQDSILG